ncbi:unnamed protein product [Closterium sp. Naga37s-1]|nr:unnamed protein product [Closterium sp. Naga37s-1]
MATVPAYEAPQRHLFLVRPHHTPPSHLPFTPPRRNPPSHPPSHPPSQTPSSGFNSGLNVVPSLFVPSPTPLPCLPPSPGFNSGLNVYDHPDPFLYQLVGTWGQLLIPAPCKQFRLWYDMRRYNSTREPQGDARTLTRRTQTPRSDSKPFAPATPPLSSGFNSGLNVYDHPDPFLYQLVGTWGQFLLPAPWKQFRLWYDMRRYNSTREPSLDGLKTTVWFKNKGNRLWTPWIIKWAYAKGMFNLYPSPPGNLSLSISHREKGSNMPKNRGADAALLTPQKLAAALAAASSSAASVSAGGAAGRGAAGATAGGAAGRVVAGGADVAWARSIRAWWVRPLPVLRRLERHDLCFRQLRWLPPAKSLEEFHSLLNAVAPEKYVSLIVVPFDGRDLINNWLCHIDGSGVSNLILIVPCARLAAELAARGYAVFYLPPVTRRRILRHLARSNAADTVTRVDPSFQMWGRLDAVDFSSSFLVVRSSPSTIAAWGQLEKFCSRTPLLTNVLAGSMVVNFDVGEVECGGGGSRQQQQQAAQVLSNSVSFKEAGTIPFGPQEGVRVPKGWLLPVIVPPYAGKKEEKIASLRGARLWVIDDFDHACKAVTCRRQF